MDPIFVTIALAVATALSGFEVFLAKGKSAIAWAGVIGFGGLLLGRVL